MDEQELEPRKSLLRDMNGNELFEGDLVIVLLEKPILVGFVKKIDQPSSLLLKKGSNRPGVLHITGSTMLAFAPNQEVIIQPVAKLVDPRSSALVSAITQELGARARVTEQVKKEAEGENTSGPSLVSGETKPDPSEPA